MGQSVSRNNQNRTGAYTAPIAAPRKPSRERKPLGEWQSAAVARAVAKGQLAANEKGADEPSPTKQAERGGRAAPSDGLRDVSMPTPQNRRKRASPRRRGYSAETPRPRRGYSAETSRGRAAAATRIFRGDAATAEIETATGAPSASSASPKPTTRSAARSPSARRATCKYVRRADLLRTGRGEAAAGTRIFRGGRRGRDADIPPGAPQPRPRRFGRDRRARLRYGRRPVR